MKITYEIDGLGWARARVSDEGRCADLTASYLSDALGNLIGAVVELLRKGVRESRCSWDEEPSEYRWIFTRDRGTIYLRILAFRGLHGDEPDDQGRLLFETVQPADVVGQAVVDCATAVLERHGEREYREKWVQHPFPLAQLQLLKDRMNPTYGPTRKRHGKN